MFGGVLSITQDFLGKTAFVQDATWGVIPHLTKILYPMITSVTPEQMYSPWMQLWIKLPVCCLLVFWVFVPTL